MVKIKLYRDFQILVETSGKMNIEIKTGKGKRPSRVKFSAVSVPLSLLREVDNLIEEIGYWPSRSAFIREACIEKIKREQNRLEKAGKSET